MSFSAEIVTDSLSPSGSRLTTMQVVFPRFILAEMNTHRQFCLAGDTMLEFDLPSGSDNSECRVHRMSIAEFTDKWINGANRIGSNPKLELELSNVDPDKEYTPKELGNLLGIYDSNINAACRSGNLRACKAKNNRAWSVFGSDFIAWRQRKPEHTRFSIRERLSDMRIRQYNEDTGLIQWSNVIDAVFSGSKDVYEVEADGYKIAGSLDHRILTTEGWKTISRLEVGDLLIVEKFGKQEEEKLDPERLKKIDGIWRVQWQRKQRLKMIEENALCRSCELKQGQHVHHIVPVHIDPSKAFDEANVTLLCSDCHNDEHSEQGWQGGTYLYGGFAEVESISFRGREDTYDLSIAGEFANFLGNKIVVHNSRNSASSRAIPTSKIIERVKTEPFVPAEFCENKPGMQADRNITESDRATANWLLARDMAVNCANEMVKLKVHKQIVNRLLEPFMWHTAIISATRWNNFFSQRCDPASQPEMQTIAKMMKEIYEKSKPNELGEGNWHLPYITEQDIEDYPVHLLPQISTARCARVSYLNHNGVRDPESDLALFKKLYSGNHMSPLEHVAMAVRNSDPEEYGNFDSGWLQFRKLNPNECVN